MIAVTRQRRRDHRRRRTDAPPSGAIRPIYIYLDQIDILACGQPYEIEITIYVLIDLIDVLLRICADEIKVLMYMHSDEVEITIYVLIYAIDVSSSAPPGSQQRRDHQVSIDFGQDRPHLGGRSRR